MLKRFREEYPKYKYFFQFYEFNDVQKECYPKIFNHSQNMIVSAPTSSGKTVLFQLLIAKLMNEMKTKCLYLAPIKSLCHEKFNSWRKKFISTMQVIELTGDTLQMEHAEFSNSDIFIATPQKIDYISRKNLNFLKQLNLLLIDEIHMLNMEDRGAILEAIVSRIMSINKKIRIMAVSATIPNIKEVAQWLKVPQHLICVFGEEYRPAKLHKVVLGFKPANNDFNFEKMLNFKILEVIRRYSYGKGSLIFCQTQKGTEQACNKLVQQGQERQFVGNEQIFMQLTNSSKIIDNKSLKQLLPHGVAFHNASLSMKDRSIVQGLFLNSKVKVLCTTSTLAMGINLPARLVIIKSTKCYKGSGKGYQQYSQIQMDQMMGRAGRMPFDNEGTVVIMTETQNYKKYTGQNKLQNLESQLYNQLIDHINTQISLNSIQSLPEAIQYFKNTFCFIRMQNSPKLYNLNSKNQIEKFVTETCLNLIKKLAHFEIIQYVEINQKIFPKQCSNNISKNAIQVQTIIKVIQHLGRVDSEREFLNLLCQANQLTKYRSKLDERKCLKELNQKNRYTLKQAISSSQKKCFVLIQAQLSGVHIDNWQLRKQAGQMLYFFKRLAYCVKSLAIERKNSKNTFWLFLFGCLFHKNFGCGFWQTNEQKVLRQIKKVASKWKNIQARGIRSLRDLMYGLSKLDIFGNGMSSVHIKQGIQQELQLFSSSLQISSKKVQDALKQGQTQKSSFNQPKQQNHLLKFLFIKNFDQNLKSIIIIIQHNGYIYHTGYLNQNCLELSIFLKNTYINKYFISVLKDGIIGFDEFYWFQFGVLKKTQLKKEQNQKKIGKTISVDSIDKKRKSNKLQNLNQSYPEEQQKNAKSNPFSSSLEKVPKSKIAHKAKQNIPRNIKYINSGKKQISYQQHPINSEQNEDQFVSQVFQQYPKPQLYDQEPQALSSTMKIKKKSKQLKLTQNFNTIKRKYIHDQQLQSKILDQDPLNKQLKKTPEYRDLKTYKWKPGFQQIKDQRIPQDETTSPTSIPRRLLVSQNQNQDEEQTQIQLRTDFLKHKNANIIDNLNLYMEKNYLHHPSNPNRTNKETCQQSKSKIEIKKYPNQIIFQSKFAKQLKIKRCQEKQSKLDNGSKQFRALIARSNKFDNKNFKTDDQFDFKSLERRDSLLNECQLKNEVRMKVYNDGFDKKVRHQVSQEKQGEKKFKSAYEYFESLLDEDD